MLFTRVLTSITWLFAYGYCGCATALGSAIDLGARARLASLNENQQTGRAASIALHLNWRTNWADFFSGLVQIDSVSSGWQQHHSDGVSFNGQPRIPDVAGTEINQIFVAVDYGPLNMRVGRQTLEWDNQRFISSNGFWQNPQSFDAAAASYHFAQESQLQYAYIQNANRIFGDNANSQLQKTDINYAAQKGMRPKDGLGDHAMHSHVFQVQWREWDYSDLTAFGYFINNEILRNFSNDTVGFRYGYQRKFAQLNYRATVSAARQQRPAFHRAYDLPYWHLENSVGVGRFEYGLDYEYLGSTTDKAIITPLGFTHEFQGWADRFTATPNKGVEDISLRNTSRFSQLRLDLRYHQFFSAKSQDNLGRELDVELSHQFSANHKIALRYAKFNAATDYQSQIKNVNNVYLSWLYHY